MSRACGKQCRRFKADYHTGAQDGDGPGTGHSASWERCPPGSEGGCWGRAVPVCRARGLHGNNERNDGALAAPGGPAVCKSRTTRDTSRPGITWLAPASAPLWREPAPGCQENLREHGIYNNGRIETWVLGARRALLRQVLFLDLSS